MDTTNVLPKEPPVLHHELDAASRKQARRDDRAEKHTGFGATTEGMAITTNYLSVVTQAVLDRLSGPRKPSHSDDFHLERKLRQLVSLRSPRGSHDGREGAQVLALCILQSGLHYAGRDGRGQADTVMGMGTEINAELWAAKLLETDVKRARKLLRNAEERFGSVHQRRRYVQREAAKTTKDSWGFHMQEWSTNELVKAGNWGMDVLLTALPQVFQLEEPRVFDGEKIWSITEHGLNMAKEALAQTVCMNPVYQPRTERPREWDRFIMRVAEDDRTLDRAQLVRTPHDAVIAEVSYAIKSGQMDTALKAVNTLQSVPYKINTWIMDVMVQCYNHDIAVEGLPSRLSLEVPDRVSTEQWRGMSVEKRRLTVKVRKGLQKANRVNDADCLAFEEDLHIATRLMEADRFYTPMNMDWRSRVYSLTYFNFAREDRVRSLFLFANGEPLGPDGLYWLKLHVANCGAFKGPDGIGIDKKPFEERIKWIDQNLKLIEGYVADPLANTGWIKADAPFLFLAACKELVDALRLGSEYICHLPVSFDGACNGLQHICSATRAPEGRHVNLTDCLTPEDVYQLVADITKKAIEADLNSNELFGKADEKRPQRKTVMPIKKMARIVLAYGVDRKLVKRNVLTFGYASKEYGMADQHYSDTMEPLELKWLKGEIDKHPFGETEDEWRLFSRYLAKRTLAAIKTVLPSAAKAMAFMQTLAQTLAHEGKALRWTTPAGVPCANKYHEMTTERIKLFGYSTGVKVRTDLTVATGFNPKISKDKAAAGIAANFTHSSDAAHLLLTVAACVDEGICDIATVHDSFGCLPSHAKRFNEIIREQFLRMYLDHDVLAELLESARADLTPASHHKLPALPEKGSLNIEEILNAKYAFA